MFMICLITFQFLIGVVGAGGDLKRTKPKSIADKIIMELIVPNEYQLDTCRICRLCLIVAEDAEFKDLTNEWQAMMPMAISCGHTYHDLCIKDWLTNNSTCPLCRHQINCTKCSKELYVKNSDDNQTLNRDVRHFPKCIHAFHDKCLPTGLDRCPTCHKLPTLSVTIRRKNGLIYSHCAEQYIFADITVAQLGYDCVTSDDKDARLASWSTRKKAKFVTNDKPTPTLFLQPTQTVSASFLKRAKTVDIYLDTSIEQLTDVEVLLGNVGLKERNDSERRHIQILITDTPKDVMRYRTYRNTFKYEYHTVKVSATELGYVKKQKNGEQTIEAFEKNADLWNWVRQHPEQSLAVRARITEYIEMSVDVYIDTNKYKDHRYFMITSRTKIDKLVHELAVHHPDHKYYDLMYSIRSLETNRVRTSVKIRDSDDEFPLSHLISNNCATDDGKIICNVLITWTAQYYDIIINWMDKDYQCEKQSTRSWPADTLTYRDLFEICAKKKEIVLDEDHQLENECYYNQLWSDDEPFCAADNVDASVTRAEMNQKQNSVFYIKSRNHVRVSLDITSLKRHTSFEPFIPLKSTYGDVLRSVCAKLNFAVLRQEVSQLYMLCRSQFDPKKEHMVRITLCANDIEQIKPLGEVFDVGVISSITDYLYSPAVTIRLLRLSGPNNTCEFIMWEANRHVTYVDLFRECARKLGHSDEKHIAKINISTNDNDRSKLVERRTKINKTDIYSANTITFTLANYDFYIDIGGDLKYPVDCAVTSMTSLLKFTFREAFRWCAEKRRIRLSSTPNQYKLDGIRYQVDRVELQFVNGKTEMGLDEQIRSSDLYEYSSFRYIVQLVPKDVGSTRNQELDKANANAKRSRLAY